jgi:hypothetical protein
MKILGIDPGTSTGLAWFENGRLFELATIEPLDLPIAIGKVDMVVFENSILQSRVWAGENASPKARLKIARNVGQIDQICVQIMQICNRLDKPYHAISPKQKGEKIKAEPFEAMTKWTRQSNQHERDAGTVAWPYRNMRGVV